MNAQVIDLPPLNKELTGVEDFYQQLLQLPETSAYTLNFGRVNYIQPHYLMALNIGVRYLFHRSNNPIRLINLNDQVTSYLERMDFFTTGSQWIELERRLPEDTWSRNPDTDNLLELTTIATEDDIVHIVDRTRRVCIPLNLPNLPQILQILSELCSNALYHSGDEESCALIQRYWQQKKRKKRVVCIAIGDLGCGIRGSLATRFGEFGESQSDYLSAALNGKTSRETGRGGLGLSTVETTVDQEGGYLWLRSETAAIFSRGKHQRRVSSSLSPIPGTQVVVEFSAPMK